MSRFLQKHPLMDGSYVGDFVEPEIGVVEPQPIAEAAATGDGTAIQIACTGGRHNGPYDLDLFAVERDGLMMSPIRLIVEGETMTPIYPEPLEAGDTFVGY